MKKKTFVLVSSLIILSILVSCVSLNERSKDLSNYEEVHLAKLGIAINNDGLYLVKMTPENRSKFVISENNIRISDINFDINSNAYIKLSERIKYSDDVSFYILIERGLLDEEIKITRIDGLISVEDVDRILQENKALEQKKKSEESAYDEEQRREKRIALEEKAKILAKGYVYHGIDESSENEKLFDSGALEPSHAYYISNYMIYANGEMGGALVNLFSDPHYQIVQYISQKVKGEVLNAGQTIFGITPISIVVLGGNAPLYIPIIIGIVE